MANTVKNISGKWWVFSPTGNRVGGPFEDEASAVSACTISNRTPSAGPAFTPFIVSILASLGLVSGAGVLLVAVLSGANVFTGDNQFNRPIILDDMHSLTITTPSGNKIGLVNDAGVLKFVASDSQLHAIGSDASQLTTGTLPDARLSTNVPVMTGGVLPAASGANLTNLPIPSALQGGVAQFDTNGTVLVGNGLTTACVATHVNGQGQLDIGDISNGQATINGGILNASNYVRWIGW